MKSSVFQIVFLFIFSFIALIGVLTFAGYLKFFQDTPPGAGQEVLLWGTFPRTNALANLLDTFNQTEGDGVKIIYEAKNPQTFANELVNALAAGTGPDLFILSSDSFLSYRDKIYPLPFASYPLKDFQNNFTDAAGVFLADDALFALPVGIDPLVLYYHKDLFAAAGLALPPSTWEQFIVNAQILTKADEAGTVAQSGAALGSFSNIQNSVALFAALAAQGGRPLVYRERGEYVVRLTGSGQNTATTAVSPERAALDFFLQFADPARATYSWNSSLPPAQDFFSAGSLAMYFGLAGERPLLVAKNPHLNFAPALIPQATTGLRATYGRIYAAAVSKNSRKREAALVALTLLTRPDYALPLGQALGLQPARRDLLARLPDQADRDVFYRSALISRPFLDPDPVYSGVIFADLARSVLSGLTDQYTALRQAENKLNLLIH